MTRFLFVATAGAGGDLQPLIAAALGLRDRGHEVAFVGDASVRQVALGLGFVGDALPPKLDLRPRLAEAARRSMTEARGDPAGAGPILQRELESWAADSAIPIRGAVVQRNPDAVVTSLFGIEAVQMAEPRRPWAVINSTFYVGPNPPRRIEDDIHPRAVPLIVHFVALMSGASLVLHATDPVFDYSFASLPAGHRYVGPLGIWEPPLEPPPYLDEPGDPWVLVSISTQRQDDIKVVEAALRALESRPVRVLVTLGPEHRPDELSDIAPNVHVEQVAPHSAVLKVARLMVSHAGHGSVMKALWHGRPMVLVPWARDQAGVAARAKALGVAEVVLPADLDTESLATAIDAVLESQLMAKEAATHSRRIRTADPRKVAASALEELVG